MLFSTSAFILNLFKLYYVNFQNYFRPTSGRNVAKYNKIEYFEKFIVLIRHPLNVIISMHDETYRTPFFYEEDNGGYDLDHVSRINAPLETFLSRRFLSQNS